jgi:hypothetical protein
MILQIVKTEYCLQVRLQKTHAEINLTEVRILRDNVKSFFNYMFAKDERCGMSSRFARLNLTY